MDERRPGRGAVWVVAWALCALAGRARAQVRLGTVSVEAEREQEEAPPAADTAFVTVVDARSPSARTASVAELVEREAGVHLRALGGPGAFTTISLRGADPSQVQVFVDGVPLSRAASGAVDLSSLPADGLERIEIYRGVVPVELGGQAVGGAINLVTRRGAGGSHVRASAGGGSFGARSLTLGASESIGRLRGELSVAYRGANGDFLYWDDNGTRLNPHDDRVRARGNDGFDQLAIDGAVSGGGRTRLEAAAHGFVKSQGVPGAAGGAEAESAHLTTGRLLATAQVERRGWLAPAIDARLDGWGLFERAIFQNAKGEPVGSILRAVTDGETVAGGLRGRAQAQLGAAQLWTLFASLEGERYRSQDLVDPARTTGASTRVIAALAIADEIRLLRDRLALSPAVRLDGEASDLAAAPSGVDRGPNAAGLVAAEAFVSPRLGARLRAAQWLSIKGSVGRAVRLPTTLELFGDGAFVLPRPQLRPELGVGGDLGVELRVASAHVRATAEGAFFGRQVADAIALVPVGLALAAANVGDVRILGAEGRARVEVGGFLGIELDYTFLDSQNRTSFFAGADGKQLPGVPRHRFAARLDLGKGPLGAFYEVLYTSDVWRDAANTDANLIPSRALHAVGARVGPFRGLTFSFEVRNLGDLRVVDQPLGGSIHAGQTTAAPLVDVYGYPLPGRAIYATLTLAK